MAALAARRAHDMPATNANWTAYTVPLQEDLVQPSRLPLVLLLAAVSFLARYSGHTHELYAYHLRRWFTWCQTNRLDPLTGI